MSTMSVALPQVLREYVNQRMRSSQYSDTSEYLRELIRRDQGEQVRKRLRELIEEGLASGSARIDTRSRRGAEGTSAHRRRVKPA